ncbi:MAG: Holliday junction resolvase RuvX [Oribacterium sp.]|nr:Holliday junction resolvase RuvX [Oribacterium sp.]
MRILGLDYGSRTVGVAISDPTGLIAQPLKTITRERESMLRKTLSEIQEIVREYAVDRIVLGLPFNMDDTEGERARKTREFREKLSLRTEVPIIFMDERLTTVAAQEILDDSGIPRSEQKKVIDQVAAGLILQTYLDDVRNGKRS